jgi:hypothetical protein
MSCSHVDSKLPEWRLVSMDITNQRVTTVAVETMKIVDQRAGVA